MLFLRGLGACRPALARLRMCVRLTIWVYLLMATATLGASTGSGPTEVTTFPSAAAPRAHDWMHAWKPRQIHIGWPLLHPVVSCNTLDPDALYWRLTPCIDFGFASCCVLLNLSWLWIGGAAGAGMIFSQGLMRMRAYDEIEEAVRTMNWAQQGAGGVPLTPLTP